MRALKTAAALGVAVLLIGGCGSSSSSAPKQTPTVALQRAAYVSSAAPGYRMTMSVRESVPGAGQVTIAGDGAFNLVPKREGSMTMHLTIPAATSAGLGSLQMQAVFLPGTFYVKLPPQLASRIPGNKPWLQVKLSELGQAAGIPGLGSLLNSSSSLNNPDQYLQFLRATTKGTVEDLGQATVNGVQTTHYHAVINLAKLPSAVPAAQRPAVQQLVTALRSHGTTQLPLDSWIDSSHLIRRVSMNYAQAVGGQRVNVALQVSFRRYGPQPAPAVPPAGQTQSLLALLRGYP